METPEWPRLARWSVSLGAVAAAFIAGWAVDPFLSGGPVLHFFSLAILIAAVYGGLVEGIAALLISGALATFFLGGLNGGGPFTGAPWSKGDSSY
jgi:K+-sensing histidine kinase KdpD